VKKNIEINNQNKINKIKKITKFVMPGVSYAEMAINKQKVDKQNNNVQNNYVKTNTIDMNNTTAQDNNTILSNLTNIIDDLKHNILSKLNQQEIQ
jgi:hypothetical protein